MPIRHRRRAGVATAALLTASLALSACSGDGDGPAPEAAPSSSAPTQQVSKGAEVTPEPVQPVSDLRQIVAAVLHDQKSGWERPVGLANVEHRGRGLTRQLVGELIRGDPLDAGVARFEAPLEKCPADGAESEGRQPEDGNAAQAQPENAP